MDFPQGRTSVQRQRLQQSQSRGDGCVGQRQQTDRPSKPSAIAQLHEHRERFVRIREDRAVAGEQFLPFPAVAGRLVVLRPSRRIARPTSECILLRRTDFVMHFVLGAWHSDGLVQMQKRSLIQYVFSLVHSGLHDIIYCSSMSSNVSDIVWIANVDYKYGNDVIRFR